MPNPMMGNNPSITPDAYIPIDDHARQVLGSGIGTHQLAWPITALDIDETTDRWLEWFGLAAQSQLQRPSSMPEHPTPRTWR